MPQTPDESDVNPEHFHLLAAAIHGALTTEQEKELEKLLDEFPAYRKELDRLSDHAKQSIDFKSLSATQLPTPFLALAMKRWVRDPSSKTLNLESGVGAIPFESDSIVLVRKLGEGGMGVVYEGFDKHLGRAVAIKFLSTKLSQDPAARERLLGEAQAVAQVQHENIVAIYAIHPSGIAPYLVQQYVRGESLQQRIDSTERLDPNFLNDLTAQLARGLSAAHRCGLIHRDLKPDNVLIEFDTNVVRIADFGLAKRQGATPVTMEGMLIGTPKYMSPEQTRGETLDHRSDLFSLGCLLYCAATGRAPFDGDDPYVVLDQIRNGVPAPLATLRRDLSPVWVAAVDRLLRKNKNERFESADELLTLLDPKIVAGSPNRRLVRWGVAIASVLALTATIVLSIALPRPQTESEADPQKKSVLPPIGNAIAGVTFRVEGQSEFLTSLNEAVASAPNDSTIIVQGSGELECASIRIRGKAIRIMAASGSVALLRAKPIPEGTREPFISTDSDLTIGGLQIESSRPGSLEFPIQSIISVEKGILQLENCILTSMGLKSACIGSTNGSQVLATNCRFHAERGMVLAGSLQQLQLRMQNCLMVARDCFELLNSDRNSSDNDVSASAILEQCTLEAALALRIVRKGEPSTPLTLNISRSILDCERQVEVSNFNAPRAELATNDLMIRFLDRSLIVKMNGSIYSETMDFFGSSLLRNQNKKRGPIIAKWPEWAKRFGMNPEACLGLDLKEMRRPFPSPWDVSTAPEGFRDCGFRGVEAY